MRLVFAQCLCFFALIAAFCAGQFDANSARRQFFHRQSSRAMHSMHVRASTFARNMPKFSTQLTGPPCVFIPDAGTTANYTVTMSSFMFQMLPSPLPATRVWGYTGRCKDAGTGTSLGFVSALPGPTFLTNKSQAIFVTFVNNITSSHMFTVDPTIHWANPNNMAHPTAPFASSYAQAQSPVPLIPHLHGSESPSSSDGHPEAWFTSTGVRGAKYSSAVPTTNNSTVLWYPNAQPAATLWYHDHALGLTRLNVYTGLAGAYIIKDASDSVTPLLPSGKYDVPLLLADRVFNSTTGALIFPTDGEDPSVHPFWKMQFFGDVNIVNGLAWPNMNVDKGQYFFRFINSANARTYNLTFAINGVASNPLSLKIIMVDGGYLKAAVTETSFLLSPAYRVGVLVDFSSLATGTVVVVQNDAAFPYPLGATPDPLADGLVMQFTVGSSAGFTAATLPTNLNPTLPTFPTLPSPQMQRIFTLNELTNNLTGLSTGMLLNGQPWMAPVSENVAFNATEEWTIVNLDVDSHPIHVHLVPMQLIRRQPINIRNYESDWAILPCRRFRSS